VEFQVLGPVEVVADGCPVAVGAGRERAVLARLLASANHVVAQETLVNDLWPDESPERAAQAVWVYVSRLRKALRTAGGDDVLVTRPPGYLLVVDPAAFDAARFEALAGDGHRAAREGRHGDAAATLTEALRLWRGPAYAGVTELPFARAEAARLEEARLGALETRVDAELACGRDAELIGELASLTEEYPLRERLWALRITALYRAGRQAEALRTYQELRRHLAEELGLEPSGELRALEGAILRQDPSLARPGPAGPPAVAEPATPGVVTFMFTDLVGSTEQLDRLGDDAADDLRRRHFRSLRDALTAHGGTEVKSLGDGLMAAFASPAAALRCAVEIQRGSTEEDFAVRIGIHAGEPIAEDDDFFGTPVVIAQRLCGRASGGQILASALVQGLTGTRSGCSFTNLGGLSLKGFGEPVAACEVHWAPPAPAALLPLPVPLARQDSFFVRPEPDMTRLEAAWAAARSGRRQLVLLAGEPGIGKTRRSAEIARTAHDAGAAVLYGRCEDGMGVPYQPFVEALGTYLRQAPAPVVGRLGGELVRLVPELSGRFPDLPPPLSADPETERYRLFDAVAAWLAAVAEDAPTVLVVEDLHWATPPTLALLGHLVHSGEPGRLLLVANYRDTPLDVSPELADAVADLLRQPDVDRLGLHGLDRSAVAEYVEAQAGHDLDAGGHDLAGVLHTETAGNPFFLNQVLRHLSETGALVRRDGRWSVTSDEFDVPDSVRDVIAQRLARLPDETGEVLAFGAVVGDHFDLALLAEAAGRPHLSVLRALDPALSARLLRQADGPAAGYRFVHALVRHTIEDALPAARRMELHRSIGAALAALAGPSWPEHAADLARHWLAAIPPGAATPGESRRVLDYAEEAARRATTSLAYEEAAAQLARARPYADLLDDPVRRARFLVALGETQFNAGDGSHRQTLLDAGRLALQLGDGALAARAALANNRGTLYSGATMIDTERVAALEAALGATGLDPLVRTRLQANLGLELSWDPDPQRRRALSGEALASARALGEPATLAHVLLVRDYSIAAPDNLDERLANTAELLRLAETLGDPVVKSRALHLRFRAAIELADIGEAERCLSVNEGLVRGLGQPGLAWPLLLQRAGLTILRGDLAAGSAQVRAAYEQGVATGQPDAAIITWAQQLVVDFERGEVTENEMARQLGERAPMARAAQGVIRLELGRRDDAREIFHELADSTFSAPFDFIWIRFIADCATLCAGLRETEAASTLHSRLEPFADRLVTIAWGSVVTGSVSHYLALLDTTVKRFDEAEAHFDSAAKTHERIGAATWLARTRLEWARMLLERRRQGDVERARELLGPALTTAAELGASGIERQAAQLLATMKDPHASRR
jgi:DNA-binding SARP family transcriptional activator